MQIGHQHLRGISNVQVVDVSIEILLCRSPQTSVLSPSERECR